MSNANTSTTNTNVPFKTQQEIWKYVADGGAVVHVHYGDVNKFEDGKLSYPGTFADVTLWFAYFETAPIVTNPTSFYGGSYYRKGNRIYILGHGIPAGVTVKHETYRLIDRDRNNYSYEVEGWSGNVEPVAKTKVWRWEKVMEMTEGTDYLDQTDSLYTEQQAIVNFPGYTKVPGSEREI